MMAKQNTGSRFGVSDALWSQLEPLIPKHENTHRFGGGRPRVPDRRCLEGILFVLRTGCQWKALDATGLVSGSTAHSRFQEWARAGVFREFWRQGLIEYDALQGIDWEWLSVDGAQTKAPLGGEKNRPQSHRPRQRRRQAQSAHRRARHRAGARGGWGKSP